MNLLDNLPSGLNYRFPRWPSILSRPYTSFQSKDIRNETTKLTTDNRNQPHRPDSSPKQTFQHHIRIPTGSGSVSPPPQRNTSFDLDIQPERSSVRPVSSRRYRSTPVRIKSTSLSIPMPKNKEEFSAQNFPKQTHEQRKVTHERKRRKQQAQILADKYAETDTWFQLKRSLSELKRLATTQEIVLDTSTTSFFNYDGQGLKQVINNEEKKGAIFKSESGISSSLFCPTYESNRTSLSTPQGSYSRPRTAKTSSRLVFEPLMAASKPIHPLFLTSNTIPSAKSRLKPPVSPLYRSRPITTPLTEEKRAHLLLSDLSNDENPPNSISQSPPMFKIERGIPSRKISTPSPLTSTIKLKAQIPRCHSATDIKSLSSIPKRFILICDQEHRIESWYHQYPFLHSDDLLTAFQSKFPQQKSIISAYFIDDLQSSKPNLPSKTFLQGKPFHINNDWKKYDLIFISNSIYEQIMIYLQTIINLIKSSGKTIEIYQIHHEEDLKKQVKNICKQQNI